MQPSRAGLLLLLLAAAAAPRILFAAADGTEIAEFKARAGNMTSEAISTDGKLVLTGEDDGDVTLWDVKSGADLQNCQGHTREVFAVSFLPGNRQALSSGDDNLLILWDLLTGKRLREFSTGDSIPLLLACSPDGALAAAGCYDGSIILWTLPDCRRLTTLRHTSALCSLLFSPNSRLLAAGYTDGSVILWDTADWSAKLTLPPSADSSSVGAIGFSADSRLLATGNQNGAGFLWNVADGSLALSFAGSANPEDAPSPPVAPVFPGSTITPENHGAIMYLFLTPDASMIFGSIQDAPPRYWDSKTGRFLGVADWFSDNRFYIARYGFTYATAAATPDRRFVVTMKENLAQVWQFSFKPEAPGP